MSSFETGNELEIPRKDLDGIIDKYGSKIISSDGFQSERRYLQHGTTSTFKHSISVARNAVNMALSMNLDVDIESLVVAALLHDYFLYDWHIDAPWHRLHGLTHGKTAAANVRRDFPDYANDVVIDSITNHMFPLTKTPPKFTEGWLVTASDKVCATAETFNPHRLSNKVQLPLTDEAPVVLSSADPRSDDYIPSLAGSIRKPDVGKIAKGFYEGVVSYRRETSKPRH